jgi:taurine dioxygenase
MASVMHARAIPPVGGDTLFADMELAYESLEPVLAAKIERLSARHSYAASFSLGNRTSADLEQVRADAEAQGLFAVHPMVRTHPETARRALYVNRGFTTAVEGIGHAESEELLEALFMHCERNVLRHVWRKDDIVIWDNRRIIHHALPFPAGGAVRHMHRTTVKGDRPFLMALMPEAKATAVEGQSHPPGIEGGTGRAKM